MKRQFQKLFTILITLCTALVMGIGIGSIAVAAAEGESTLSLSLVGNSTIYLQKGTEYKEFGATAYDTVEGDLTESIVINNTVNKDTVGTYTVSYSVSNASSQTASASRTVIVFDDIKNENIKTDYTIGYSGTNTFKCVIATEDGGFVAWGSLNYYAYHYHYEDEYVIKYDENLNVEWSHRYGTSNYARDLIIDDVGNIFMLSNNGYRYLDSQGNNIYSFSASSWSYTDVEIVSENEFWLFGGYGVGYLQVKYDSVTDTWTNNSLNAPFDLNNAFVLDGFVFAINNNGTISKWDLTTDEVSTISLGYSFSSCKHYVENNSVYLSISKTRVWGTGYTCYHI